MLDSAAMSRAVLWLSPLLVSVAACGGISPSDPDASPPPVDAPPAEVDAPPGPPPCPVERFDGILLGRQWEVGRVGPAAGFQVKDGQFVLTEPKFADTPSMPGLSWVYDDDTDKGNQLVWSLPIGTGDFDLVTNMTWGSTNEAVWLGGVGVTGDDDRLEAWAGAADGSSGRKVDLRADVRVPGGTDATKSRLAVEDGNGTFRITRTGTLVSIRYNNDLLVATDNAARLSHVVIVNLRHRNGAMEYAFGSFSIDSISVTYPGCAAP